MQRVEISWRAVPEQQDSGQCAVRISLPGKRMATVRRAELAAVVAGS